MSVCLAKVERSNVCGGNVGFVEPLQGLLE